MSLAIASGQDAQTDKQTAVILKRQVPIRFGEAPRSWLGGLPMMPESVEWPRAANGMPLHFIAEIDCADLPTNLWDGLGPRQGWLLLFVDVLEFDDLTANGAVRVLHVDQLGPERQPPEDMPTVRHSMSDLIGYEAEFRPGVPKMWRRWPVDLGPEADAFISAEIEKLGKAHLVWGAQLRASAESLMAHILTQDLDAPLSAEDWRPIEATFNSKSTFWRKSPHSGALERIEQGLNIEHQLRMALREDALDAYARNNGTNPPIPKDLLAEFETRLRSIYENRPHRMGGQTGRIQPDSGPVPDGALLFQMGSDEAMGWSWGDAGALYVTVSPDDLRQGRFDRVQGWIEGY